MHGGQQEKYLQAAEKAIATGVSRFQSAVDSHADLTELFFSTMKSLSESNDFSCNFSDLLSTTPSFQIGVAVIGALGITLGKALKNYK
jgi:hypothetical protein